MATFVDRVTVHARGGKGGNGCASVHREKFKPLGGPDGGNGGHGGSVIAEVDPQVTTLLSFHHQPHQRAEAGKPGEGDFRAGKRGEDLILKVPNGTVVTTEDGEILADLTGAGTQLVLAAGGRGGLGNAALASAKRKAPGFALLGEDGEERSLVLELKSMADVALVGFPSAGKSSLISVLSAAKPKIADYPFTTLVPHLGVVEAGGTRFTIADVPGLIPGASEGKGLGLEFLRHIERCAVIVHVLDCATLESGRDPITDLDVLERELAAYAEQLTDLAEHTSGMRRPLMERPRIAVLNKIDVPEARELAELVTPELEKLGLRVYAISTATHEGLSELTFALADIVSRVRETAPPPAPTRQVIRPKAVDDAGFTITAEGGSPRPSYRVRGAKPERWVKQTDFSNDEAVGYLADRLNRLGVEDELMLIGAQAGDTVIIGPPDNAVVFDWEPSLTTGAELLGPRGSDARLYEESRPTRRERREAYYEMMDAREAARQELWTERQAGIWTDPSEDDEQDNALPGNDPHASEDGETALDEGQH